MAKLSKKNEELLRAVQRQAERESGERGTEAAPSVVSDPSAQGEQAPPFSNANESDVGLGVDLLEIDRMERAIERTPRIVERVFTSGEREYAWTKARPAMSYALFFAAREAVLKALGCGFAGVEYQDVEVTHDKNGKPEVLLHGNAKAIADKQGVVEIQISLSHTHQMAVASAVAIKALSRPRKPEQVDPMAELSRQFKELRSMLDDLGVTRETEVNEASEESEQEHE